MLDLLLSLLMLVYELGAIVTFFWIGSLAAQEKGFVGAFIVAKPWAMIWPIALIMLLLMAEKKK